MGAIIVPPEMTVPVWCSRLGETIWVPQIVDFFSCLHLLADFCPPGFILVSKGNMLLLTERKKALIEVGRVSSILKRPAHTCLETLLPHAISSLPFFRLERVWDSSRAPRRELRTSLLPYAVYFPPPI